MKLSVLGAGAIGSMLGGLVKHHRPELDVTLIVRGEHGRRIQDEKAVTVNGPWGSYQVPVEASEDPAAIAGSDMVLITVKSHATHDALAQAAEFLDDCILVSIQNGINTSRLEPFVPPERLVLGMTATNMAVLNPGSVDLQLDGATILGPASADLPMTAARTVTDLLQASGLQFIADPHVLGTMYNKMAMNALGYASCISASNFISEAICHTGWRRSVGQPIVDECLRTLEQSRIQLSPIPGRPDVPKLNRFLKLLNQPVLGSLVSLGAQRIYNRKPIVFSLYQDLKRGRKTEVEYINGEFVRLADSVGIDAPCNRLVIQLVHELEAKADGTFLDRAEVLRRFQQLAGPHRR